MPAENAEAPSIPTESMRFRAALPAIAEAPHMVDTAPDKRLAVPEAVVPAVIADAASYTAVGLEI
jgi:hypothetical protein